MAQLFEDYLIVCAHVTIYFVISRCIQVSTYTLIWLCSGDNNYYLWIDTCRVVCVPTTMYIIQLFYFNYLQFVLVKTVFDIWNWKTVGKWVTLCRTWGVYRSRNRGVEFEFNYNKSLYTKNVKSGQRRGL